MEKSSKKSQDYVEETMSEMKEGKLKSGSGKKVTNPKQAIAIGLSEAREDGVKVAPKKSAKQILKRKPLKAMKKTAKKSIRKKRSQ